MDKKIRNKISKSLNGLALWLRDEGCNNGICEICENGRKILRDIPLETLLDVSFIISKNIFLESADDLIGKSIKDLRGELHKILKQHFLVNGKHQDGKEYVDLVGYYGDDKTIRIAHFFPWALYQLAFEDGSDILEDICIKIPYYISVASILSRGGINDSFDFTALREKIDNYVNFNAEEWYKKVIIYLNEAHEAGMAQNEQSAGTLKTLQGEFEYLILQMNERNNGC